MRTIVVDMSNTTSTTDTVTRTTEAAPTEGAGPPPSPEAILELGMAFWGSKTLLSAVELGIFTVIGDGKTAEQLADAVGLHPRSRDDFLDALVALGMLRRDGDGPGSVYRNTPETALFLSTTSPAYVGGMLEMANTRLFGYWNFLTEALRTGEPQNEIKDGSPGLFDGIYASPERLEEFMRAMEGIQTGNFLVLADTIDFSGHRTFCDLGGANGALSAVIARANPHMSGFTFDLPPVGPIATRNLAERGVADRVEVVDGDFFVDPFPPSDVFFLGNVLHDWNEAEKQLLIGKAYEALPPGGMLIAIENVIDDARREHAFGLLMSLNMLIELPGGFDYTGAQFDRWCRGAGFERTSVQPLAGPSSAAIAYKA